MVKIDSFDNKLDEAIVKRGRGYFKDGCVKDLEQVDEGVWRALVEGTEIYDTTVTLINNEITHHRCSCPYDLGSIANMKLRCCMQLEKV